MGHHNTNIKRAWWKRQPDVDSVDRRPQSSTELFDVSSIIFWSSQYPNKQHRQTVTLHLPS